MTSTEPTSPEQLRNHWWWRPGWRVGRRFYTWHLTFDDQTVSAGHEALRQVVSDYQAQLTKLPGLDLVPPEWLHLTMQGLGFVDEVSEEDVREIVTAVRARCAPLEPLTLTLGPAVLDPEAVMLQVAPSEPVARLRSEVRAGIADVWGVDHVPESADGFTPHVSLAYANTDGPAAPYAELLSKLEPASATVTIRATQLIVLGRDEHLYRWEPFATVPLGD